MRQQKTKIAAFFAVCLTAMGMVVNTSASGTATREAQKKNHVIWERTAVPRHRVYRKKFEPWAQPSVQQVHRIIDTEAARFGASEGHLSGRIYCESKYLWYASNGQYQGLGQFASETFNRGVGSMGSRKVRMVIVKYKPKRVITYRRWSRGELTKKYGRKVRVRRKTIYRGSIPTWPNHTHGWAQVRIMSQAMVGRSAVNDSEWACR